MKFLDLFCGAGGAAMGYYRAGFKDITGVDNRPQKNYPFKFIQADALEYLAEHGHEYDVIHASPPCQGYSVTRHFTDRTEYPDLLGKTRTLLIETGKIWIIENVPGAPMRAHYKLCGPMFGLKRLKRERWFETSFNGFELMPTCNYPEPVISVCGHDVPSHQRKFGRSVTLEERKEAMGIDWMNRDELGLAIPPAYTEWVGSRIMELIS